MAVNTAQISNPTILVKPSDKLRRYISNVSVSKDMPSGISNIVYKNKVKGMTAELAVGKKLLITEDDRQYIKSLKLDSSIDIFTILPIKVTVESSNDKLLSLQDLHWLHERIMKVNKDSENKVYLHELIEGSEIILPKNQEIPRNMELDMRCRKLKAAQANKDYHKMTKNVDNRNKRLPEDTLSYQLKQMNKHLVAIFQFILSVLAGFAFGFIGVELIIGSLDFGFRLLLGIICALTIALAELYFLAKKLNEDLEMEYTIEKRHQNTKLD